MNTITGAGLPLMRDFVDTDIIAPATELLVVTTEGLADVAFKNWRFDESGEAREAVFNDPRYSDSTVLLAGQMFGCGSSREHAVWALKAFGIRVIVASSFGEIFQRSAARNGLVPVVVDDTTLRALAERTLLRTPPPITFHLDRRVGHLEEFSFSFQLSVETVRFIVDGYDEIDATMKFLGLTTEEGAADGVNK